MKHFLPVLLLTLLSAGLGCSLLDRTQIPCVIDAHCFEGYVCGDADETGTHHCIAEETGDDDSAGGDDDDSAAGDDDDSAGGDDDDSAGDDDDDSAGGDDDDSAGDDDDSASSGLSDIAPQGITMIALSGGTFDMGCTAAQQADSNCEVDESPVHSVTLTRDFWMGKTEVTQAHWNALIGNNPSQLSACGMSCPVENVNWWDAASFANGLSAAEGLSECYSLTGCSGTAGVDLTCSGVTVNSPSESPYDCEGYRLPTEAEWEYAARAGTDLLYAGSDTVGDVAWGLFNGSGITHPVATKPSNAWGLHDMSGNVWEWNWDWYDSDYYDVSPLSDPVGPTSGVSPSYRGGSVDQGGGALFRVSSRHYSSVTSGGEDTRASTLGFRLARTIPIDSDGDGLLMHEDCDDGDSENLFTPGSDSTCSGTSCLQLLNSGYSTGDGTYWIDPAGTGAFQVYCDMSTNGGGWGLFARHTDTTATRTETTVVVPGVSGVLPAAQWLGLRDSAVSGMMFVDEDATVTVLPQANFETARCVKVSDVSSLVHLPTIGDGEAAIWHDENVGCDVQNGDYSYVLLDSGSVGTNQTQLVRNSSINFSTWGYGSSAVSVQDEMLYFIK